jgi:hypothetical protein
MHMGATVAHSKDTRERARQLYQDEGLSPLAVSERLNVPKRTVQSWANRGKWLAGRTAVADALAIASRRTASEIAETRGRDAERMINRTISDVDRLRDVVLAPLDRNDELGVLETKALVQSYRELVGMSRQAFGLDNQAASVPGTLVNISLSGASLSSPIGAGNPARPIDVASVDTSGSIPTS